MPKRLTGLKYKTAMTLAFEEGLRKAGYDVPEDVRAPMKRTAEWAGPRDAA